MARLDAYIRVSRVMGRDTDAESFISVEEQKRKIGYWAKAHDHEIVKTWEELDVSGSKDDRPMLNEVMRRIEAGETDGLVVATLDRFSRSLMGALTLLKRIDDAGGVFAAVDENVDLTSDIGRVIAQILFSFAELEWRRRRSYWDDAVRNAVERGVAPRIAPFGYRVKRGDPTEGKPQGENLGLEPDPEASWVVTELFERRAGGQSFSSLLRWIQSTGVQPHLGAAVWGQSAIQKIVKNEVYLGKLTYGKHENRAAHRALTDPATFEAASRSKPARQAYRDIPLLRGLVRCAGCRYTMTWQAPPKHRNGAGAWYKCSRAITTGDCPAPASIAAEDLRPTGGVAKWRGVRARVAAELARTPEDSNAAIARRLGVNRNTVMRIRKLLQEGEELFREALPGLHTFVRERAFARLPDRFPTETPSDDAIDLAEFEEAVKLAEVDLEAYAGSIELARAAGEKAFAVGLEVRREAVEIAQVELDEARRQAGVLQAMRDPREDWESMTPPERNQALQSMVQAVFVRASDQVPEDSWEEGRKYGASDARIHIVWIDEAELDLPRQGRRDFVPHPFLFLDQVDDEAGVLVA